MEPAGAGDVLHDDRLAEHRTHALLGDDPCDRVARAAGGERHDHGHRLDRIASATPGTAAAAAAAIMTTVRMMRMAPSPFVPVRRHPAGTA